MGSRASARPQHLPLLRVGESINGEKEVGVGALVPCHTSTHLSNVLRGTSLGVIAYWKAMMVIESLAWLVAAGGIGFLGYQLVSGLVAGVGSGAAGLASQLGV